MSKVKVRLKSMLSRTLTIMRGRNETPLIVGPRQAFEVDADELRGTHFQSLLKKNYLREVRRRTIEEKPPEASPPTLSSSRKIKKKSKFKEDPWTSEASEPSTDTDDPVSPDPETDGK